MLMVNCNVCSADVKKLEEKTVFPPTVVAVVGETGSGKSSLMNALLEHSSILPTSGMRACTSVVVEINNNTRNNKYEGEIEFLTVEVFEKKNNCVN